MNNEPAKVSVNLELQHLAFIKQLLETEVKRLEKVEGGNAIYKLIAQEVLTAFTQEVEKDWTEFIRQEFSTTPEAVGSIEAFRISR